MYEGYYIGMYSGTATAAPTVVCRHVCIRGYYTAMYEGYYTGMYSGPATAAPTVVCKHVHMYEGILHWYV
jgi:hypothetical protein